MPFVRLKLHWRSILFLFLLTSCVSLTQGAEAASKEAKKYLFIGTVNAENINVRLDSTVSSEVICKVNKDEQVEVISELYGWYKIRLPAYAPSFIKKDFVEVLENDPTQGLVAKENVNIRLRADIGSAVLGKVNKQETLKILEDLGEWYKIEPVNSFGWIHKNFVDRIEEEAKLAKKLPKKEKEKAGAEIASQGQEVTVVEGIIKPKTFKRLASHKLITTDKALYLLKGTEAELSFFNHRKVKIVGKIINPSTDKNPIIAVETIESLD